MFPISLFMPKATQLSRSDKKDKGLPFGDVRIYGML